MELVNLHEEGNSGLKNKNSESQIFLRKSDKIIKFSYGNCILNKRNPESGNKRERKVNISYGN